MSTQDQPASSNSHTTDPNIAQNRHTAVKIRCGLSDAFHNKALKPGFTEAAWSSSFRLSEITLPDLIAQILNGGSWTPGCFRGNTRTTATFLSSQLIPLDFDHGVSVKQALANPFIRQYAFLAHATASSSAAEPRIRVIFRLSEPVTDAKHWSWLVRGVMAEVGLEIDVNSAKPAQSYHGSTNRIEEPYINLEAVLPLDIAEAFAAPLIAQAEQQKRENEQRYVRPIPPSEQGRADKYSRAAVKRTIRNYTGIPGGIGQRHSAFVSMTAHLIGMQKGGWPGLEGIALEIEAIGYQTNRIEQEVRAALNWADRNAEAQPFELPEHRKKTHTSSHWRSKPTAAVLPVQPNVITAQYVSDALSNDQIRSARTLLLAAPVGMGKTTVMGQYANTLSADILITGVAQFRLLTSTLAKTLDATHYEDASGRYQQALGLEIRFVTSVSSLPKFSRVGGVVILDEIEGCLQFVLNSRTFRQSSAVASWRALKRLIIEADQLIGMDAGLSDITINLIQILRGEVTVRYFRKAETRGDVILLDTVTTAIYLIAKLLSHQRGTVYVPCSSEATATKVADYFSQVYRVKKITRDTSNTEATHQFVLDAGIRQLFELVVYTSAMGAGVDISEPVYAVVGIFDLHPLAPEQALQLFGRVRDAQRYYAACPCDSAGYETPTASHLLADRIRHEHFTAIRTGRSPDTGADTLEMLQVWAAFRARQLQETAQWRRYFVTRLQRNGYGVKVIHARAPQVFQDIWTEWEEKRADAEWEYTLEDAHENALPTEDLERLRMQGVEINRDLKLRNTRFRIEERLAHSEVQEQDRDLFKPLGREKYGFLVAVLRGAGAAIVTDREQAEEGRPLQHRDYLIVRLEAFSQLLRGVGFQGALPMQMIAFIAYFSQERSAAEVDERFAALTSPQSRIVRKRVGHNGTNAETAHGLCHWFLGRLGISLQSKKRGGRRNRQQFYWIDSDERTYKMTRALRTVHELQPSVTEPRVQNIYIDPIYVLDTESLSLLQLPSTTTHLSADSIPLLPALIQ